MSFYGQQIFNIPGWLLSDGTIDPSRLPDFTDGVVIGQYTDEGFKNVSGELVSDVVYGKIFVDVIKKDLYVWVKENEKDVFKKVNKDFVDENNDGNIEFK